MSFATSEYNNIDHPIDRSLLGTCAITLLFLIVSLTLFGPFIAILVPAMLLASISRFIINIIFCTFCNSGSRVTNNEYYSPDRYLRAEECRWLESKSKMIILMIIDGEIEIGRLKSLISSRLINFRKCDTSLNPEPGQQPPTERSSSNKLMYPKFSQIICNSNIGWKWKFDEHFDIENHIRKWTDPVSTSTLYNPQKLSDLISGINKLPMDLDHPPWDSYLVHVTDIDSKIDSNSQVNQQSDRSLLIFRVHPSLSDGVSLVHILCASLSDEQCPIELKDRFHSSGKFLNSIRALFIGPVVFIQKWLLTRRDCNIFHPVISQRNHSKVILTNNSDKVFIDFDTKEFKTLNEGQKPIDQDNLSFEAFINNSKEDRLFHFCTYPLSAVSRIKCVTRSTFTEIFLATIAGALRTYEQRVSKVQHPYDLLCLLPTDMTKEHHTSGPCHNSSSMASKTSNQSIILDHSSHILNNYSLVDFGLPTNTEGMIPRLWEIKQRMEELKNSADSIILCGLSRILKHLFPENVGRKVMNTYYNKNSLSVSSLQGPDTNLFIDGKEIYNIVFWFPSLCDVSLTMSCFSYGDTFTCSIAGENSHLAKIELILDSVIYQMDLLNKLLENRRIPGEHKSQRFPNTASDDPKVTLSIGKFDSNEKDIINKSLSPSISSDHLYTRLSSIQNQLQNDKDLSVEELDILRSEFSNLMGILRRRKSCGIDSNGEMADFDEEIEEMSDSNVVSRRPSLPGLMVLSTRRRSLATSLTRPLSTGNRSRSNSKAALQSSNYLLSPSSSSSKRASLRILDDIESGPVPDHHGLKIENKFWKHDKTKYNIDSNAPTPDISRLATTNETSPSAVSPHSFDRSGAERHAPRRCREDRV